MSQNYLSDPKKTKSSIRRLYKTAAILLIMASASLVWTSSTLARYTADASGSDSAQVAGFVVTAASNKTNISLNKSDDTVEYPFSVSNSNSSSFTNEVRTNYGITVKFPSETSGISLRLKKGDTEYSPSTADNKTYIFENVGTFEPGKAQTDNLTLNFKRQTSYLTTSWSDISVTVNAVQVVD